MGVCNFEAKHLDQLAAESTVVPAVNQIEWNPRFNQIALRQTNAERGIVTQSWSPIGGARSGSDPELFDLDFLKAAQNRSAFRWALRPSMRP